MGSRKVFLAKLSFAVGVVARNKFKSIGNLINRQANKIFAEMFFFVTSLPCFFSGGGGKFLGHEAARRMARRRALGI